jgi:hypothetical protein
VLDHLKAVVQTVTQRLQLLESGKPDEGKIGGSTYGFDIWPGHPCEQEVLNLLRFFPANQQLFSEPKLRDLGTLSADSAQRALLEGSLPRGAEPSSMPPSARRTPEPRITVSDGTGPRLARNFQVSMGTRKTRRGGARRRTAPEPSSMSHPPGHSPAASFQRQLGPSHAQLRVSMETRKSSRRRALGGR